MQCLRPKTARVIMILDHVFSIAELSSEEVTIVRPGGQRIMTALLYLTTCEGGETVFRKAHANAVGNSSCIKKCVIVIFFMLQLGSMRHALQALLHVYIPSAHSHAIRG